MNTKVVYNNCYGGFGLSSVGLEFYNSKKVNTGLEPIDQDHFIKRNDSHLVETVLALREKANDEFSSLTIEEISPDYVDCFTIHEYDGLESVVCDPKNLVSDKLRKLNLKDLTSKECRVILEQLQRLIVQDN